MVGFQPLPFEPTITVKFFSAGLAACIADCITFPLDTAKVRLQIQGEAAGTASSNVVAIQQNVSRATFKYRGIFGTIRTMSAEEGVRSLYNGLIPGLQRQMCFASIRIGLYDSVKKFYQSLLIGKSDVSENVGVRILAGITSGGFAVLCAQPTDVVKVRMQAQKRGVPGRYSGTMHAYRTIGKQEGLRGLWKGTLPNVTRNAIVNASELVSYDLIKEQILRLNILSDNLPCHFVSAFGAGFVTTCVASPVDVVKTRFMNSPPGKYNGAMHCAVMMFKEGGLMAFYKGFMPSFMRLGSWNIAMFVFFEQLKRAFMQHRLNMELEVKV